MPPRRRDEGVPTIVKVGVGFGAGYLLYMLISGLGFGRGAGTSEPGKGPASAAIDDRPLEVLIRPRAGAADPDETEIVLHGQPISVDHLIERVHAGGRSDLTIKISGATIERQLAEIISKLTSAGISVNKQV